MSTSLQQVTTMNPNREKYAALGMLAIVLAVTFSRPGTVGEHLMRSLIYYSVPLALWFGVMALKRHSRVDASRAIMMGAFAGYALTRGVMDGWLGIGWLALAGVALMMGQRQSREATRGG